MRTVGSVPAETLVALAGADTLPHMGKVLPWLAARGGDVEDLVIQDEFTHDVIARVHDAWLVYDTT